MNRRVLVSLGIIAALLLALAVVRYKRSADVPEIRPFDGALDEILITRGDETVRIRRHKDSWLVGDAPYAADGELVANMENRLKSLSLSDLISEEPRYERYDLADGKAIHVVAKSGGKTARELYIGKKSSTYRHTYVRLPGDRRVYLAAAPIFDDFNKSVQDLRDKHILSVSRGAVESLEITYKGARLSLAKLVEKREERSDEKGQKAPGKGAAAKGDKKKKPPKVPEAWVCREHPGVRLNEAALNQLLGSFEQIKAADFPDVERAGLGAPQARVRLRAFNKTIELAIFKKEANNRYLCTSSESSYVFSLDAWMAERYFKTIADLKEK